LENNFENTALYLRARMLLLKQWRFQIWRIRRLTSIRGALTTLFMEAQRQKYRGTTKYYISRRPGEEA